MTTTALDYADVDATSLRTLCAFKDGTIDILQRALENERAISLVLAKEVEDFQYRHEHQSLTIARLRREVEDFQYRHEHQSLTIARLRREVEELQTQLYELGYVRSEFLHGKVAAFNRGFRRGVLETCHDIDTCGDVDECVNRLQKKYNLEVVE